MMRKTNEDLFIESLVLNENDYSLDKVSKINPLRDYLIDEFILVRVYDSITITLLHSGGKYIIPIEYFNIFKEFTFYNYSQLNCHEVYPLGKFIYEMSTLVNMVLRNFKNVDSDDITRIIRELSASTTNDIRQVIYNKLKITIGMISYESLGLDELY